MMQRHRNRRVLGLTLATVAVMASLAWASVPVYSWFCRGTGVGGATVTGAGAEEVLDRVVTIRFDANRDKGMPWSFRPETRTMKLRIGETGLAYFIATNPTDHAVAGQASYNVTPYAAGGYFTKIECFCFTQQVLGPGETARMPVSFYVDPAMVDDPDAKFIHTITLSYTFYQIDIPEEDQATLTGAGGKPKQGG